MQTRLSAKGQIVLPGPIRHRLGISTGDLLDIKIEGKRIVLTAQPPHKATAKIINDPITGLPVISAGKGAPVLTSQQVEEILSDFP